MFWDSAQSSPEWGPPLEEHRRQVGYCRPGDPSRGRQPQPLNSQILFNPAARPALSTQLAAGQPQPPEQSRYSPPPPAYNGLH